MRDEAGRSIPRPRPWDGSPASYLRLWAMLRAWMSDSGDSEAWTGRISAFSGAVADSYGVLSRPHGGAVIDSYRGHAPVRLEPGMDGVTQCASLPSMRMAKAAAEREGDHVPLLDAYLGSLPRDEEAAAAGHRLLEARLRDGLPCSASAVHQDFRKAPVPMSTEGWVGEAGSRLSRMRLTEPVARAVLAATWLVQGYQGSAHPPIEAALLAQSLGGGGGLASLLVAVSSGTALVMSMLLCAAPRMGILAGAQALAVLASTAALTAVSPDLWTDPYGPMLKNVAFLVAIWAWDGLRRARP